MTLTSKTIAVFGHPFNVPGFDEMLPAGEYEIETENCAPPDRLDPDAWLASVCVKLHTRASHPGLERVLTVTLADLDHAHAMDKVSGRNLTDIFLEYMFGDPLVRLAMQADGVTAAQIRELNSASRLSRGGNDEPDRTPETGPKRDEAPIRAAENEGMPVRR
ncbi:hypothetical protein [Roseovarius sp. D22-M7]|uniref:hypothetical protein n=1 Tax=Roseovarius sp. D22-M7 TaxID=3127116 RepID=UPI00300FCA46